MAEAAELPARTSLLPPVLAIALAVVGTTLMIWTFGRIVELALGGGGTLPFQVLFFAGAALDAAAVVIAVVGIARDRRRGLSGVALGFALVPVVLIVLLAVVANR